MATSSQNGSAAASVEVPISDPYRYEENADYALRKELGLREIFYPNGAPPVEPDCPSWCWMRALEGHVHQVEAEHPFIAQHTSEDIEVALTYYKGERTETRARDGELVHGVGVACLGITIKQDSNRSTPEIWLRRDGEKLLVLSPDDACDLATVLTYLVAQVDAREALS